MQQIDNYIEFFKHSWSPETVRLVEKQLSKYCEVLFLSPSELHQELQHLGGYTRKQTLIRIAHFRSWAGDHSLTDWIKQHRNLFKSSYVSRKVPMTLKEAKRRIANIPDARSRRLAEILLRTGLRISELKAYDGSGTVIGKGGKRRPYLGKESMAFDIHPNTFRYHLSKAGLRPHDLRKLCMTELANQGLPPQDLCYVAGWSDIKTAYRYLQPSDDDKLKEVLNAI